MEDLWINLLFSPCSGLILTVASKTTANDSLVDTYLNDRMNDYKKYKKMLSLEKIDALRNNYYYENDNLYKGNESNHCWFINWKFF